MLLGALPDCLYQGWFQQLILIVLLVQYGEGNLPWNLMLSAGTGYCRVTNGFSFLSLSWQTDSTGPQEGTHMNTYTSRSCTPPCRCAQLYSRAQRGLAGWHGLGNVAGDTLHCLRLHAANSWFVFCFAFGVKKNPKLKKRQKPEKKVC